MNSHVCFITEINVHLEPFQIPIFVILCMQRSKLGNKNDFESTIYVSSAWEPRQAIYHNERTCHINSHVNKLSLVTHLRYWSWDRPQYTAR
jgi:hypothetical protein